MRQFGATKSVLYESLKRVSDSQLTDSWKRLGREQPFREDLGAEESPLLEAVAKKRLLKTQWAGKYLRCASDL
jgi:hypothetical protein